MKSKTIKCGSRSITVRSLRKDDRSELAWLVIDDIGNKAVYAMDVVAAKKLRDALGEVTMELANRYMRFGPPGRR